jgi:catechol 1,2-dioxygenase
VAAEGYHPVTTHLFDPVDPYLDSDAVFGVKDSLITDFTLHDTSDSDAKRFGMTPPFCTAKFDFLLSPKK